MGISKVSAKIWNNFITGLVVLLPTIITLFILRFIVVKINDILFGPMVAFFSLYIDKVYIVVLVKIVILVLIIGMITLIGVTTRVIIVRKFFSFGENLFIKKVPMVGKIYNVTKQISGAFFGQGKAIFKKVLLVEYPRKGVWSIGFMTEGMSAEINDKTKKELISVFIPMVPNPTTGMYLLVPREEVIFLDMSIESGLKLAISGGIVMP